MTVAEATLRHYMQVADRNARVEASKPQVYGGDLAIAGLRAFIRYHKDATQDVQVGDRMRSLTHKQVAMHGLVTRMAVAGNRSTVTAMAKEANVVTSTMSRFLTRLQSWGYIAADITRGRNGGVRLRLRSIRDGLQAYAHRAWAKVCRTAEKAISRTKLNVASSIPTMTGDYDKADKGLLTTVVLMDATFNEVWDAEESRGRLLAREIAADKTPPLPRHNGAFDPGRLTAANVVAERYRLAFTDPEGEREALNPLV